MEGNVYRIEINKFLFTDNGSYGGSEHAEEEESQFDDSNEGE